MGNIEVTFQGSKMPRHHSVRSSFIKLGFHYNIKLFKKTEKDAVSINVHYNDTMIWKSLGPSKTNDHLNTPLFLLFPLTMGIPRSEMLDLQASAFTTAN